MNRVVLAFDVGIHTGWASKDNFGEESGHLKLTAKRRLTRFKKMVLDLIDLCNPTEIVYGKPNMFGRNFFNVLVFHSKLAGIIELCAEQKEIVCTALNDSEARKLVFGKNLKKQQAQKQVQVASPDEADAIILVRGQYKKIPSQQRTSGA